MGSRVGIGEFAYLGGGGGLSIGDDCIIGQYFSCHPENHLHADYDTAYSPAGRRAPGHPHRAQLLDWQQSNGARWGKHWGRQRGGGRGRGHPLGAGRQRGGRRAGPRHQLPRGPPGPPPTHNPHLHENRVLITAYAVNPYKGSEDGMGWNFILQAARFQRVVAVTRRNNGPAH